MSKTLSAVAFDLSGQWRFLEACSPALDDFRHTYRLLNEMGIAVDCDLENAGLDQHEAVRMALALFSNKEIVSPLELEDAYNVLAQGNYTKVSYSTTEMSVSAFLAVCHRQSLGVVFL